MKRDGIHGGGGKGADLVSDYRVCDSPALPRRWSRRKESSPPWGIINATLLHGGGAHKESLLGLRGAKPPTVSDMEQDKVGGGAGTPAGVPSRGFLYNGPGKSDKKAGGG